LKFRARIWFQKSQGKSDIEVRKIPTLCHVPFQKRRRAERRVLHSNPFETAGGRGWVVFDGLPKREKRYQWHCTAQALKMRIRAVKPLTAKN